MRHAGQRYRHQLFAIIFLGLLLAGLAACGQKGPLFMPPTDTGQGTDEAPQQDETPEDPQQDVTEE